MSSSKQILGEASTVAMPTLAQTGLAADASLSELRSLMKGGKVNSGDIIHAESLVLRHEGGTLTVSQLSWVRKLLKRGGKPFTMTAKTKQT